VGFNRNNFIERSIMGAFYFLKESIFAEEYAGQKGLLQSLDPRAKAISIFFFIIQAILARSIHVVLGLYAICLILSLLSKINLGFFLKRTWFFIPLFSLLIAVPALFSAFSPGEAVATFKIWRFVFIITRQGVSGAGLFVARVATSVSFAVLLSITTKHFRLLKVLRSLGVPQIFLMTLGMCYRYVFLFVEIIENTYRAIKSRAGIALHYKKGQRIVASTMASLWARSFQMNEEVYKAMLSRGYRGEPVVLEESRMRVRDWLWLGFCAAVFVLPRYGAVLAQLLKGLYGRIPV
jgi:cobalt/nickel transport system permease protein